MILKFITTMKDYDEFAEKRRLQANDWLWALVMDDLKNLFLRDKNVASLMEQVQTGVSTGVTTPSAGAKRLLGAFRKH